MKITKEQLEEELMNIDKIIQNRLANGACEQYISIMKKIEDKGNETEDDIKADFYTAFGYFLLQVSEYEECLKMFIRAQNYGCSKDEIKELIWTAFIEPNLDEFKNIYSKNIEVLISNGHILSSIDFEELDFWLIPTTVKNEYYIYDKKERLIKEKFKFNSKCSVALPKDTDEFSDFLILEESNWNKIKSYADFIRNRSKKTYVVVKDIARLMSYFQADFLNKEDISDLLIFDEFSSMKEYFNKCSEYLPRNIIDFMNSTIEAKNIINEIHEYRISSNNISNRDNVLLSVCIPSYNRGKRAYNNILHHLQSYYDEEIEFVLSNNGTKNETKDYYKMISHINDTRLKYYEFEENQGYAINLCKTLEIARGRFVLLLSDKDLVNLSSLSKIIYVLNNEKDTLAVMRTKSDVQGYIPSTKFTIAGEESILTYMLSSNYISGIIFNNLMIKKYNCIDYIKENINNAVCLYYTHMVWELMLCQYGNAQGMDIILINEGKAEKTEFTKTSIGTNMQSDMPYYATHDGRLEQHKGFYDIFRNMEICKNNFDIFRKMYINLCNKTVYLVNVSVNAYYKNTDVDILDIIYKLYEFCIKYLDKLYADNRKMYKKYYNEDLQLIKLMIKNNFNIEVNKITLK